ncbi:MAG: DUF1893 domain-containing protein [Erysipelotrichales bacterium]|nr:DUF1893 domain-containing protein [Erysipelotrichales bacterium]
MNKDLEKSIQLMKEKNATLTLVLDNQEEVLFERGVKPLMMLLSRNIDYSKYSASDRVIGKAAALLYINLGIKNIYCELISEKALQVFKNHNINITYDKVVPLILNRDKTGYCPMESLVLTIDDPIEAYEAIKNKIKEMSK